MRRVELTRGMFQLGSNSFPPKAQAEFKSAASLLVSQINLYSVTRGTRTLTASHTSTGGSPASQFAAYSTTNPNWPKYIRPARAPSLRSLAGRAARMRAITQAALHCDHLTRRENALASQASGSIDWLEAGKSRVASSAERKLLPKFD